MLGEGIPGEAVDMQGFPTLFISSASREDPNSALSDSEYYRNSGAETPWTWSGHAVCDGVWRWV